MTDTIPDIAAIEAATTRPQVEAAFVAAVAAMLVADADLLPGEAYTAVRQACLASDDIERWVLPGVGDHELIAAAKKAAGRIDPPPPPHAGTPKRIGDHWGALIYRPDRGVKVGDAVVVTTRSGESWEAEVTAIVERSSSRTVVVETTGRPDDVTAPTVEARPVGRIDRTEMMAIRQGGVGGRPSPTWDGNRWLTN